MGQREKQTLAPKCLVRAPLDNWSLRALAQSGGREAQALNKHELLLRDYFARPLLRRLGCLQALIIINSTVNKHPVHMPFGPRGNGAAGKVTKAKLIFNFEGDCELPHIRVVLATQPPTTCGPAPSEHRLSYISLGTGACHGLLGGHLVPAPTPPDSVRVWGRNQPAAEVAHS